MSTPANAMNLSSSAGIVNWDGVATMATTALTQYNTLVGASSNTIASISPGILGQVLTSNGAAANPSYQTLPFVPATWNDRAISFAAAANTAYFVTAVAIATLPAVPAQGNTIVFTVDGVGSLLTITANAGQTIRLGKIVTAVAGTAVNNFQGDSITLVYRSADSSWIASEAIGTWTLT